MPDAPTVTPEQLADELIAALNTAKASHAKAGTPWTVEAIRSTMTAFFTARGIPAPPVAKKPRKRQATGPFTPPSPEEVATYGDSIGYLLDGHHFCDSYEAKGWMVGRSKMKDWKAAVRNWKTNNWGKLVAPSATPSQARDYTKI